MRPLSLRFAPLLLLLLLLGCSTMDDASGKTLGANGPHVYGGVRTIMSGRGFVKEYLSHDLPGGDPWVALVFMSPVLADLGLSLVMDTLLLPWSLSK